jgi:hypothetical protein
MTRYVETGCACCDGICGCACHWSEAQKEDDELTYICAKCEHEIDPYNEDVYYNYTVNSDLQWLCEECKDA